MTGHRLRVLAWGETPMDALDHHMALEPMERPVPGPGEVVLAVRSCAVGWVDLLMSSGQYQHMAQPPYTPGLEFAGVVDAVGEGVAAVAVGDRVLADGLTTGPRSHGAHRDGGLATWAVIPEASALRIPDRLTFDQAVNLLGNYETAYHGLVHRAQLRAGEAVLVLGATGSTGLAAVHVAKHLGATVIAVGRSAEKLAVVAEHGADHVLVGSDDLRARVKALGGVDVVWDGVGGPISVQALRSLRFGGRFCIIGWAATPFVAKGKGQRGSPNANQLPTNWIQMKGLDVLGCPAVLSLKHWPELRAERLDWLWKRIEAGDLVPHHGPAYPLADFREALRAKWESRFVGGCVVHPG